MNYRSCFPSVQQTYQVGPKIMYLWLIIRLSQAVKLITVSQCDSWPRVPWFFSNSLFQNYPVEVSHDTGILLYLSESQGGLSSTIWHQVDFVSTFQSPFPSSEYRLVQTPTLLLSMTFNLSILTESNKFNFVKTATRKVTVWGRSMWNP